MAGAAGPEHRQAKQGRSACAWKLGRHHSYRNAVHACHIKETVRAFRARSRTKTPDGYPQGGKVLLPCPVLLVLLGGNLRLGSSFLRCSQEPSALADAPCPPTSTLLSGVSHPCVTCPGLSLANSMEYIPPKFLPMTNWIKRATTADFTQSVGSKGDMKVWHP